MFRLAPAITRSKAIRLCRQLWRELAASGDSCKPDWAQQFIQQCPLCHYVQKTLRFHWIGTGHKKDKCIKYCPLEWPGGYCFVNNQEGLFRRWNGRIDALTTKTRKEVAKQIAELPRKPLTQEEKGWAAKGTKRIK